VDVEGTQIGHCVCQRVVADGVDLVDGNGIHGRPSAGVVTGPAGSAGFGDDHRVGGASTNLVVRTDVKAPTRLSRSSNTRGVETLGLSRGRKRRLSFGDRVGGSG
jgi:hypothetical protein